MAICQGLGLALAVGIGGPLAALFVAMMAALGSGIHPDRTDYDFLGATWFLVTLLAVVVIFMLARGREALRWPTIAVLAAIGAIVFAASLAEDGHTAWPGLVAGALATAFAAAISSEVLAGAISRAEGNEPGSKEADAANFMIVAFAAAGIVRRRVQPVRSAGLAARARRPDRARRRPAPSRRREVRGPADPPLIDALRI